MRSNEGDDVAEFVRCTNRMSTQRNVPPEGGTDIDILLKDKAGLNAFGFIARPDLRNCRIRLLFFFRLIRLVRLLEQRLGRRN